MENESNNITLELLHKTFYSKPPHSVMVEYEVHMSRNVDDSYDFTKLENFIKKICELHKEKTGLRIKVTGIGF